MATERLASHANAYLTTASEGFKYNLQVLPDTILASSLLFSLLFQSPPFMALTASLVAFSAIQPHVGNFLSQVLGGTMKPVRDGGLCTGRFPGVSFQQLMNRVNNNSFGDITYGEWPSYYSMFIGFMTAYMAAMPVIYSEELKASPRHNVATVSGLVLMGVLVLIMFVFRFMSGCDSGLEIVLGLFFGALLGLIAVVFLAWISERRLTNLLSMPLIRDRATDGKPIYVCERK